MKKHTNVTCYKIPEQGVSREADFTDHNLQYIVQSKTVIGNVGESIDRLYAKLITKARVPPEVNTLSVFVSEQTMADAFLERCKKKVQVNILMFLQLD